MVNQMTAFNITNDLVVNDLGTEMSTFIRNNYVPFEWRIKLIGLDAAQIINDESGDIFSGRIFHREQATIIVQQHNNDLYNALVRMYKDIKEWRTI